MVDNLITLYEHNETEFKTNGLGSLNEAVSCSVYEERNGEFDLTMEYPVTGRHFSDLIMRRIIFTKPNPYSNPQPFRIYEISKPINGIITVSAHHISYDLDGYPLAPFNTSSLLDAFEEMNRQMKEPWNSGHPPFHFSTTKTGATDTFNLVAPCSARALLGGSEGTILDHWPGEYEWDIWEVKYHQNRGADRGVTIEYGKNLTDLEQEENCENCWTDVYPYYYTDPQTDEEGVTTGGLVQLDEKIVSCPGDHKYRRVMILDLTSEFEEQPTQAQLKERAQKYIEDNELGSPKVSLTVSFISLSDTTAYSKLKILEEVRLCDTVHVYFPLLNVASTSTCISTTYNVLADKYTEIELGEAKSNLASTLVNQSNETEQKIENAVNSTTSYLEDAINRQSQLITGNAGGYVLLHDTNGDGKPDEFLVIDRENLSEARNVWRWNLSGLGHSSTGYNGDYTTGWTMDGHFNASLITVGELMASLIKVGILSDRNGNNYWNMETGEFRLSATTTIDDKTIPSIAEDKANGALNDAKKYTDDSVGNFVEDIYTPRVEELQKQIDGQIETYYYDYEPTLQNQPASLWDDDEKARHEGDLFYWKSKGYAYRFFKDGTTWKWQMVQDTDITQALERAKEAKDTADKKRRVFVAQPEPPYDIGDLWVQGPEGDIYRCQRNKSSGVFSQDDWILASKYTDDSKFIDFLNGDYASTIEELKKQDDQKSETWWQSVDPSSSWSDTATKSNHIGDMWYCTNASDTVHYQKYWIWNGTTWTEMKTEPPQEIFDRFDSKAQIFIDTPEPPYQPGDLWFQSETSDIMTCVKGRDSGSFDSGDWEKRNKYTDDSTFNTFFTGEYKTTVDQLKKQADQKAETWYQETDPANAWNADQKKEHVGDLWYNSSKGVQKYYRYDGTIWQELTTSPPDEVFDRIDGKAQIFVGTSNPTVPYYKGDLWFKDANSDILTCITTRKEGSYTASEWQKYNKYTDNSDLENFLSNDYKKTIDELRESGDKKAETWYQEDDPSTDWSSTEKGEHIGDLWYNSTADVQRYYRWDGTNWQELSITPPQEVFDEINRKAQIFLGEPYPPYDIGDLWFGDDRSDIMTCVRRSEGKFNPNDWMKMNKYTDDSAFEAFFEDDYSKTIQDITTQLDKKAETWYQNDDPSTNWSLTENLEHKGDMWYCTKYSDTAHYDKYWIWDGNMWTAMSAIPPAEVFDQIDGKAQIFFYYTPNPPYKKGDLWFKDANSDILTCQRDRESGDFSADDWGKWNKYIDKETADRSATDAVNAQTQEDIFNRLTDGGKNQGIFLDEGILYINGQYMVIGKVSSKNGKVYFDLDNNELHCDRLVSSQSDETDQTSFSILYGKDERASISLSIGYFSGSEHQDSGIGFYSGISNTFEESGSSNINRIVSFGGQSLYLTSYGLPFSNDVVSNWGGDAYNDGIQLWSNGDIVIGGAAFPAFHYDITGGVTCNKEYSFSAGLTARNGIINSLTVDYLTVSIGKSRVVSTDSYGKRLLYSYETAEPMFGDIGFGETDENGDCLISLDDVLLETFGKEIQYCVFLQKEGPGDIWVSEKRFNCFLVKGTPNLKFSWEIKGHQRDLEYDRLNLEDDQKVFYDVKQDLDQEIVRYEKEYELEFGRIIREKEQSLYETAK